MTNTTRTTPAALLPNLAIDQFRSKGAVDVRYHTTNETRDDERTTPTGGAHG